MDEVAVRIHDLPWEQAEGYPSGTQRKILLRNPESKPKAVLLKLPPGFDMAGHSHVFAEHHYVMEGEYESMGRRYGAGYYRMIPAGTNHGPFRSELGALVLVVWEM